ncbi:MAG: type IV toxin-antitoxin system AbiEi family antitoxin [Deltaproteobacteria bacterium]|nr:type IV toxin-antitoxin system AbiEi family antitoxin [Deltaproteobacteria bacterium]
MTSHHAANWLDTLAARGRAHFVTTDAVEQLGISIPAAHATLARLLRKGRIASPYRGFYVIVPPEYRSLGCLPAEQFVDQLMTWLREPYHVGLLTAAAYHGAAHQRPQRTQVIVGRSRRRIRCGSVQVDFITRHDMSSTPTQIHNTRTGHLLVSTPEATALEIVGYAHRCSGLGNVATVLVELGEAMQPGPLANAAMGCPIAWVQRLGWLLEQVEHRTLAAALLPEVGNRAKAPAPLMRSSPRTGAPRDPRWRLIVNAKVEADEL